MRPRALETARLGERKTAVAAGELDQEIAVAADMVRARFKK